MAEGFDVIMKIVLSICIIIISTFVVPYLKSLSDNVRWQKFVNMVCDAVEAAEQLIKEPGSGVKKKEMVIAFIKKYLDEAGINVTDEELNILIEAAVKRMNDKVVYVAEEA